MQNTRRNRAPTPTIELTIEKLVFGGAGLGRHRGRVVFVPFTAPGDRALVRIVEQKKNFAVAEVFRILEPGPARVDPVCSHFSRCGGCQWQHVDYTLQLEAKRSMLDEVLKHRFPETRGMAIKITASPHPYGYRSRARIQVDNRRGGRRIGFFRHHSHKVEDVAECPLFRPGLNRALAELRCSEIASSIVEGELEICCSEETGQWAASAGNPGDDESFHSVPDDQCAGTALERRVGDFTYRVSPSVFFQANDSLVADLTRRVIELCTQARTEVALELYAGAGLFTLPLSRRFRRLTSVEDSESAAALCMANLETAGVFNVEVMCADVCRWLREARPSGRTAVDLILLDPPRAGAGVAVMEEIAAWNPAAVVYVSCDMHTLSRDIARLRNRGYRIDAAEGFDLFPQTYHSEVVLRLRRE